MLLFKLNHEYGIRRDRLRLQEVDLMEYDENLTRRGEILLDREGQLETSVEKLRGKKVRLEEKLRFLAQETGDMELKFKQEAIDAKMAACYICFSEAANGVHSCGHAVG